MRTEGTVGHIVLNRPRALNAITTELGRALHDALVDLASRTRVVVIRGAEGNFSVGGDFRELERLRAQGPDAVRPLFENFARACAVIPDLPIPVVAAVEGYAMAGGFELMQACDIAVVRSDAELADNHVNFGQIPGGGGSQRLPRLAGRQRALGHLLGGEPLSGDEAAAWGLAYRSLPPETFEAGVQALAERIAGHDPAAVSGIKNLVHNGFELPLPDALAVELDAVVAHVTGDAAARGIAAFHRTTAKE
ncbi:enoyl-CoA hydratase/isomerase family protein [Nocardia sp. NEAU-351]|uniref:Enoyl-CoA hydratase/isomerase family protein n=1 Tax=Nocardia bovistercoris TaxID=2785916 RepID=A0A931I8D0_9NOCA|nr:enoyl-CoA hydratase/isomerase family protein [Nocardia bovistercoris]